MPETTFLRNAEAQHLWARRLDKERAWRVTEGAELDFRSLRKKLIIKAAALAIRCAGFYGRGRRNTRDFVLERHTFFYPDLPPALDGFQILQLSDMHFSNFDPAFGDSVAGFVCGLRADLCLVTGDYRYGYFGPCDYIAPVMRKMLEGIEARFGFLGIMGNHDISPMVPGLEEAGLTMLINRGELLHVDGASLWLGGVDDQHWFQAASVRAALEGAPEEAFKILLAHTPENAAEGAERGFDLCLSGHTHGGQLCFPIIGPLDLNAHCDRAFKVGKWRCGGMQGYTSRGLGSTDIPVRFNCRPEATMITLKRGEEIP